MAATKEPPTDAPWMLRRPLQIESLRQGLPDSVETERLLADLQNYRENLDAVVYALSNRELALDRREHLLEILRRHQTALDECLSRIGLRGRIPQSAPLWHYQHLDPIARTHLSAILGVPEEPPFYEVLDIKAEEYLSQCAAFEGIAEKMGFRDRDTLPRGAKRSALVLTLSGSLIQLSEPMGDKSARRYLYQNIYGNAHPPDGSLVLDRDIRVGHRLRSVELTTSPVRMLRVTGRRLSWKAQSQNFEKIAHTLSTLVSRSSSRLAEQGWLLNVPTSARRGTKLEAAERVLREDYHEAFARFEGLRARFLEVEDAGELQHIEAELLTLCHYLQTASRELGFEARALEEVCEFVSDDGQCYLRDADRAGTITILPRGNGPEVALIEVSVGRQLVTLHAPLALVGKDGGVVEVTAPIARLKQK
jgi:hypothetical protein